MGELANCPFCGGEAAVVGGDEFDWIACLTCCAIGPYVKKKKIADQIEAATAAWNTRAAPLRERLWELEGWFRERANDPSYESDFDEGKAFAFEVCADELAAILRDTP